jgi:P2 family phage major capsid protein
MRNETRIKYNAFLATVASLNQVADATAKFTVDPTIQQKLETKIQESSAFLQKINIIGVTEQSGEKLGLGINSTIAGRTDTSNKDRQPVDPSNLTGNGYKCVQTNFDTVLRYAKLDAWSKFPDFAERIRNAILQRQGLDRIMIGFNGVTAAKDTNRITNPLLQDVNKGWVQKVREEAPQQVMSEGGVVGSDKIYIYKPTGDADTKRGDYGNLDALVFNMVSEMLPAWYQDDPEMVVVLGRELLSDKYLPMVNEHAETPSENAALDMIVARKMVGGLPAVRVPYFPANALMITRLDNLSIYWQEGSRRRSIIDNPKRDQVENYESSNEDYAVEDYEGIAIAENITFGAKPAA